MPRGAVEVLEAPRVVIADAVGETKTGSVLEVLDEARFARIVERVPDTVGAACVVENRPTGAGVAWKAAECDKENVLGVVLALWR